MLYVIIIAAYILCGLISAKVYYYYDIDGVRSRTDNKIAEVAPNYWRRDAEITDIKGKRNDELALVAAFWIFVWILTGAGAIGAFIVKTPNPKEK